MSGVSASTSLWDNSRDSIAHAIDHYFQASQGEGYIRHSKWTVLSVHHAAETFCYMILKDIDENNAAFFRRDRHYYPGLQRTIRALLHPTISTHLGQAEQSLLKLFRKLDQARDRIYPCLQCRSSAFTT
jgi:hypothetical protein